MTINGQPCTRCTHKGLLHRAIHPDPAHAQRLPLRLCPCSRSHLRQRWLQPFALLLLELLLRMAPGAATCTASASSPAAARVLSR